MSELSYLRKSLKIYFNLLVEKGNCFLIKLNKYLLKTYPLIEDCARCEDCGRNVHDFRVPDELWKEVYGNEGGVLCYDCFCNRTDEKLGIKWRMNLVEKWSSLKSEKE